MSAGSESKTSFQALRKVLRFASIYGLRRTYYKIAGRRRDVRWPRWPRPGVKRSIAVVGCGQFAFATIGYFLTRKWGIGIAICFDVDEDAGQSFQRFYRVPTLAESAQECIEDPRVNTVYIASNHASHTDYAIAAIESGKTVYVEKPVAVDVQQMARLSSAVRRFEPQIFAGYNRPFAKGIRELRELLTPSSSPLTYSCAISGHRIPQDHWYRNPAEGTRVCGNIGHWLDLLVHILGWEQLPDRWEISLTWSDNDARDDDLSISLISERGDLANIVLSSRAEPFEGISENIQLQWGDCIARIDDFRRMRVNIGSRRYSRRYWPKDAGHSGAIQQPWSEPYRSWREVEKSSLLTLKVANMVQNAQRFDQFSFSESLAALNKGTE